MNEAAYALWMRALHLVQMERWPDAFRFCRQAIAQDVEAPDPHSLMAVILLENGYPQKALTEAREACRLAPEQSEHHRVLSIAYGYLKDFQKANEEIEIALELDPQDLYSHVGKARLEAIQEKWNSCEKTCRQALTLDADHEALLVLLGHSLEQQGKTKEAKETLHQALQLDPESPTAQRLLGQALLRSGDVTGARQAFRESLRQDPEQDEFWHEQAVKGGSFWYRPFLRFTLFMARLPRYVALFLIIGLWAGHIWIARMSEDHPSFRPYGLTLSALYIAFVLYTWLADPIANFLQKRN